MKTMTLCSLLANLRLCRDTRRRVLVCVVSLVGLSACGSPQALPLAPRGEQESAVFQVQESKIQLLVDGEIAHGLAFAPYRDVPGDRPPSQLITFCHGHGEQAADFAYLLAPLAAATGALIVAMDYRDAPGNEPGDYSLMRGYQDTVAATRWALESYSSIQTSDLWGWSMGGFVSGMAAAYDPELYRYWVASFPGVNAAGAWALFTALDALGVTDDAQEFENDAGCTALECPEAYVARSPSLLASQMNPARAIILHGVFDPVSPYEQGREMFSALVANQVPATMYSFLSQDNEGSPGPAGHGHGTRVAEESLRVVQRLLAGTEVVDGPVQEFIIDEQAESVGGGLGPAGQE